MFLKILGGALVALCIVGLIVTFAIKFSAFKREDPVIEEEIRIYGPALRIVNYFRAATDKKTELCGEEGFIVDLSMYEDKNVIGIFLPLKEDEWANLETNIYGEKKTTVIDVGSLELIRQKTKKGKEREIWTVL